MQRIPKTPRRLLRALILLLAISVLAGPARADDAKSIKGFRDALVALGPDVDPAEAELVSVTSHTTARRLQKEWRVAPVSIYHNFLIHIGAREKGFCFDWAYGIGGELKKLPLKTLVLHWGASYPGTRLEHNCIVVTRPGQPFREGYIIDGWRAAGRLLWWPVKKDNYPWKEDLQETAWLQDPGPATRSGAAQARKSGSDDQTKAARGSHASSGLGAGSLE